MNYKPEDFSKCVFNPLEDNLPAAYPVLKELFDLPSLGFRLIRYAIACYDPNSPLHQDIQDRGKKKEMAAYLAGYDLEDEAKYLDGVYSGKDEDALNVIHHFLRTCIHSRVWAMIVSNEETFWEYNRRLKEPISKGMGSDKDMVMAIEKKSKLAEDQEIFHNRIIRLYKEFFHGDEDVAKAAGQAVKSFNPQQVAKALKADK